MNQPSNDYFHNEENFMTGVDFQTLVTTRLEDLADRVETLLEEGRIADALLLRNEGLELAEAYDFGLPFFYANDFNEVK